MPILEGIKSKGMVTTMKILKFVFLTQATVVISSQLKMEKGKRNELFQNIYKTDNILWTIKTRSASLCIASCNDHIDCRSVAYNKNDNRCQIYSRDFTNQAVVGTSENGWTHYDVSPGNICGSEIVTTTATDCSEVQSQGHNCSGIYRIQPSANIVVDVMCELSLDSGRWTVIQKRQDGSVDFYLDWAKYKNGFGNPFTEYWIGNEALYALTQFGKKELLILMETWDGVWKHARYSDFCISSEIDQYRLTLSGYTGTSGDSLLNTAVPQSGQKFSTRDRDNDGFAGSCNPDYHPGGWWFKNCGRSDLNGFYYSSAVHADNSCHWWSLTNNARVSLRTIRMMVRKV